MTGNLSELLLVFGNYLCAVNWAIQYFKSAYISAI